MAVRVGANVGAGQITFIKTQVDHAPLARALARQSYAAGARYVDVGYGDEHVRRAMIELGPDSALDFSPKWQNERYAAMAGNAMIATTGDAEPHLLADLDGERVGRARPTESLKVHRRLIAERTMNWTGVGYPNAGWARQVPGPAWSGSGTPSPPARVSTKATRSRHGGSTWTASTGARPR